MQKFNYHTHTYRCGHAIGSAEEYIISAIEAGFEIIGISEHMAYLGWDDPNERLAYDEVDEYLAILNELKEKYKDKIQVRIGFECEYFDDMKDYLLEMKQKCDYLICGQHAYDRKEHYYHDKEYASETYVHEMCRQICAGMEVGLFKYIAHLDYFMLGSEVLTSAMKEDIRAVARCAKKYGAVLEINLKGIKYGMIDTPLGISYRYPNDEVFKIIGEEGCKVVFGYDAHYPNALLERDLEKQIQEKFLKYHLIYEKDLVL